jgi:hypothetical protein
LEDPRELIALLTGAALPSDAFFSPLATEEADSAMSESEIPDALTALS